MRWFAPGNPRVRFTRGEVSGLAAAWVRRYDRQAVILAESTFSVAMVAGFDCCAQWRERLMLAQRCRRERKNWQSGEIAIVLRLTLPGCVRILAKRERGRGSHYTERQNEN